MSLIKKLAGETVIYGLGSVLPRVLNFIILTPYLTNIFSREAYGVHGMVYAFSAILMIMLTLRMETTFFRFGSQKGQIEGSFSTGSIALLITALLGVGIVLLMPAYFSTLVTPSADNAYYIKLIAIISGLDILCALPYARLRLENRPMRFAMIRIINVLVMLGVLFFCMEGLPWLTQKDIAWANAWFNPDDLLQYPFIANIMGSLCGLILLSPVYFKMKWQFDAALFKKMIWYAAPLIIVGIAGVINNQFDRILIGKFLPGDDSFKEAQTGVYNAAVKIAVLMQLFITAFNYAAEPFFFRHADRSDSRQVYADVGQLFTIVGSFAYLAILLYLDIFQYLIGKDFRAGLSIVPIMLMAYLFQGLYYNFSIWYKLTDRTWIGGVISVLGSLILLSIDYSFIGSYGYTAAAWAAVCCFGFMAMAGYLTGKANYPIPYPIFRMIAYMLLAVFFYFLSEWIRPFLEENLVYILLANTVVLLLYCTVIFIWEKKMFMEILKG